MSACSASSGIVLTCVNSSFESRGIKWINYVRKIFRRFRANDLLIITHIFPEYILNQISNILKYADCDLFNSADVFNSN